MLVLVVTAAVYWLSVLGQVSPDDPLSQQVLARVANPLLTSAQFLIPAAVAISGIHKMMEHRAIALSTRHRGYEQPPTGPDRRTGGGRRRLLAGTCRRPRPTERRLEAGLQRRARLSRRARPSAGD